MASFEQDTEMVETKHADASVSPQRSSGNDRDLSNKNKGPDIVSQDVDQELRKLRFQNYVPRSDVLKTYCEDAETAETLFQQIVKKYEGSLYASTAKFMDPALDLNNLVPRKGNSDMKRVLQARLAKLEKRTQRAILDMARRKQLEEGDLTGPSSAEQLPSSDED